ncbi:DUF2817 domain-containing protein [Oceanospirillum maris]|uniref:DUF2817 domain-containing protein n=1 Tax=Oceanospirillum maris TaxID=64977 RepID=UPI0003FDD213|nr:DUF2817 domain-containing protein [Oceanospirillum maris]
MPLLKTPVVADDFVLPFAEARRHFRSLASTALDTLPGQLLHFAHPETGPQGEALSSDWLWLGENSAPAVLVIISGTHGVEGYAGSGLQRQLLSDLVNVLQQRAGLSALIIHTLNPWGYAWQRRGDHNNIDLNRNFVDFSQLLPTNADFNDLHAALMLPARERSRALNQWQKHLGNRHYEQTVSGGQYQEASSLFYGGQKPSWSQQTLVSGLNILSLNRAKRVLVLDLHTGLGPYGYGELISDHPFGSAGDIRATQWFGDQVSRPELGTSSSVPKTGLMDYYFHRLLTDRGCFLTYEMGTYGTQALFDVLCEEQRMFNALGGDLGEQHPASLALMRHFCPDDVHWQAAVTARLRQVVGIGIDQLLKEVRK